MHGILNTCLKCKIKNTIHVQLFVRIRISINFYCITYCLWSDIKTWKIRNEYKNKKLGKTHKIWKLN